jgi:hypothetical protein|nr:MAG TPA: hypothetical protein [Caudoviricetes sp.]DAP16009.1 MAG TPA: hypothetical protein [Caudoviricetes sp.]
MPSQTPSVANDRRVLYRSDYGCFLPRLWEAINKNESRSIDMKIEQYPSWLVPVGIAKKLKIIGFDIPCEFSLPLHLYGDFDIRELEFDFEKDNHNDYIDKLSIPTWEQALAWFREKGYILCVIESTIDVRAYFYNPEYFLTSIHINCKTYEETREKLILRMIDTY